MLYSNNMVWLERLQWPRLELIDGFRAIESPAEQSLPTRRYRDRAIRFLEQNRDGPFFLYLCYTMPHLPLAASEAFAGRSGTGLYAEVVEELDASVGQLLGELSAHGLDNESFVFFTSDNGPWTGNGHGGSTGHLRGFKGTTWEGGLRITFIARAPGRLPAGEARNGAATLADVFPTLGALARAPLPSDRTFDGVDMMPLLLGEANASERNLYFSQRKKVNAVRSGRWKLHLRERPLDKKGRPRGSRQFDPPQLYRLDIDPAETQDVAAAHPEVVDRLRRDADRFVRRLEPTVSLRPFGGAILRGFLAPIP